VNRAAQLLHDDAGPEGKAFEHYHDLAEQIVDYALKQTQQANGDAEAIARLDKFYQYLLDTQTEQLWNGAMMLGVLNAINVLRGEPFAGFKP
jgi:hypothetical protein